MTRSRRLGGALWIAGAALCLPGCVREDPVHAHGKSVTSQKGAEAREGEIRIAETIWTDALEIFIDRGVPVVGEPADFAIHFTELATGLPAAVDDVTLKLTSPTSGNVSQKGEPGGKGIHTASVVVGESGDWDLVFAVSVAGASLEVPSKAIRVFRSQEEAASAPLEGDPDGIAFFKEQQWDFEVRTRKVERRPISSWKSYPAVVKPRPGGLAHVVPSIAGRLLAPLEGALPRLGDRVEAGQTLARVEPPLSGVNLMNAHAQHHELETHEADLAVKIAEAEAGELRSQAALELAEEALERVRGLAQARAKSARELEQAEYDVKVAVAAYRTARTVKETYGKVREELHAHPLHDEPILDRFPSVDLKAPISGRLDAVRACLGEHIRTDAGLFVIVDTSSVHVEAMIPERDMNSFDPDSRAFIRAGAPGREGALRRPLERVHFGLRVDATRRVPLLYSAANDDGRLRLGMMAEVEIEIAPPEPRMVVPASALVDDRGVSVVFVALGGEAFERRPVTVGMREGGLVEIREGVAEGERVVTRGAYLIRLASLSSAIPGHHH